MQMCARRSPLPRHPVVVSGPTHPSRRRSAMLAYLFVSSVGRPCRQCHRPSPMKDREERVIRPFQISIPRLVHALRAMRVRHASGLRVQSVHCTSRVHCMHGVHAMQMLRMLHGVSATQATLDTQGLHRRDATHGTPAPQATRGTQGVHRRHATRGTPATQATRDTQGLHRRHATHGTPATQATRGTQGLHRRHATHGTPATQATRGTRRDATRTRIID